MLFEHLGADIPVAQSKQAQTLVSNWFSFVVFLVYGEVVEKDCRVCKLNKEDAMDHIRWRSW